VEGGARSRYCSKRFPSNHEKCLKGELSFFQEPGLLKFAIGSSWKERRRRER